MTFKTSHPKLNYAMDDLNPFKNYLKATEKTVNKDEVRSNLAKEPNPFEQSFIKNTLTEPVEEKNVKAETQKPTLPSISSLNKSEGLDFPVKLSPMILYPSTQSTSSEKTQTATILHPPLNTNPISYNIPATNAKFNQSTEPITAPTFNSNLQNRLNYSNFQYAPVQNMYRNSSKLADQVHNMSIGAINQPTMQYITPTQRLIVDSNPRIAILPDCFPPIAPEKPKKSTGGRKRLPTEGMNPKKIDFLERNRKAALKCRQRKKDEFRRLEESHKYLDMTNKLLVNDIQLLSQEAHKLRAMIIAHGNCPIARAAGVMGELTLPAPSNSQNSLALLPLPL